MEKLYKDLVRKITFMEGSWGGLALAITCKRFYRMFNENERLRLRGLGVKARAVYFKYDGGIKCVFALECPRCGSTDGLHSGVDSWECLNCDNLFMLKRIKRINHFKIPIIYKHNCKNEFCKIEKISGRDAPFPEINLKCYIIRGEYWIVEILRIEKYLCYPLNRFYKFDERLDISAYLKRLWDPQIGYNSRIPLNPESKYLHSHYNDTTFELDFCYYKEKSSLENTNKEETQEHREETETENLQYIRKSIVELCKEEKWNELYNFCREYDIKIKPGKMIEENTVCADLIFKKSYNLQEDHEVNKLYIPLKTNGLFDENKLYSKSICYLILYSHHKKKFYIEFLFFSKLSPHYKDLPNLNDFIDSLTV